MLIKLPADSISSLAHRNSDMKLAAVFVLFASVFAVGSWDQLCTCYGYVFSGSGTIEGFKKMYANFNGCGSVGRSYCRSFCSGKFPEKSFDAVPGSFGPGITLGDQLCRRSYNANRGMYQLFSQACDQSPIYAGVEGSQLLCCNGVKWTRC